MSKICISFMCTYSLWQPPKVITFESPIGEAEWNLLGVKFSNYETSGLYHIPSSRSSAQKSLKSDVDSPPITTMYFWIRQEAW